jgi:hypothetical protein
LKSALPNNYTIHIQKLEFYESYLPSLHSVQVLLQYCQYITASPTNILSEENMKKLTVSLVLTLVLAVMVANVAFAAGGAPAAHGVDGRTFGTLVSTTAQSAPGALAEHTSGGNAGGAPDAHGVDGRTFGYLVSMLAQSAPGAVAAHVSGK